MKLLYSFFYRNVLVVTQSNTIINQRISTYKQYKKILFYEYSAIICAAFIGGTGVILLYLPEVIWPTIFSNTTLKFMGHIYELQISFWLYGIFLSLTEIVLLTFLNIYFIGRVAETAGYLNLENKKNKKVQNIVLRLAKGETPHTVASYGLNPYLNLKKRTIIIILGLQKAKGIITNSLVKAIIGRMGGRLALKTVQNLAGIPVYAFWDAWGARAIMRRTRAVILGKQLIKNVVTAFPDISPVNANFKQMLFDSLELIAVSKRYFHENHTQLCQMTLAYFDITGESLEPLDIHRFILRLQNASNIERQICTSVILLGIISDERLTLKEEWYIHKLNQAGLIHYSIKDIKYIHKQFMNGEIFHTNIYHHWIRL